jgi:hypothetical protein
MVGMTKWIVFLGLLAVAMIGGGIVFISHEAPRQIAENKGTGFAGVTDERPRGPYTTPAPAPGPAPQPTPAPTPAPAPATGGPTGTPEKEYLTIPDDSNFHRASCARVQAVPANRRQPQSWDAATRGGWTPCPDCKP